MRSAEELMSNSKIYGGTKGVNDEVELRNFKLIAENLIPDEVALISFCGEIVNRDWTLDVNKVHKSVVVTSKRMIIADTVSELMVSIPLKNITKNDVGTNILNQLNKWLVLELTNDDILSVTLKEWALTSRLKQDMDRIINNM